MRTRAVFAAAVVFLSGCGPAQPAQSTLVVFGASSLKRAFTEIAGQYRADHPGVTVEFTFAGSSDLLSQLRHGARADVLATADTTTMTTAVEAGLADGAPVDFAANTLTIVVAPGNPSHVTSLRDLARTDLAVVVCAPQVPCGSATAKAEEAAGVRVNPVSEESQVTDVLTKVTSGQADAGVVYVTDAKAAGDKVSAVAVADSPVNTYPIAVLRGASNPALARGFVDAVNGESGQKALAAAGFAKP